MKRASPASSRAALKKAIALKKAHRRDRARAIFAALCFGCAVAFLLFVPVGTPWQNKSKTDDPRQQRQAQAQQQQAQQQSNDDLQTGPIVFMPMLGDECRMRVIDNETWRIQDKGVVSCETALAQTSISTGKQLSIARADAIRAGFSKR